MSGGLGKEVEPPSDFNKCVSKDELTRLLDDQRTYITKKFEEMMQTINNLVTRIEHVEQRPPPHRPRHQPVEGEEEEDDDTDLDTDRCDVDRLRRNRQGMGGTHNRGNNDPFAKTKFTMIPFARTADPEVYLDWELTVEIFFNSHLVLAEHRVRLATSEFTSFAPFWWNDLCTAPNNTNAIP
jgi:hypothetical protein